MILFMALTLTREQINDFLHHLHPIPVSRGWTREWREKNAPGWETNDLSAALKKAGAVERSDAHHSGWRACVDSITVHEND